jgi:hypothetical protein
MKYDHKNVLVLKDLSLMLSGSQILIRGDGEKTK